MSKNKRAFEIPAATPKTVVTPMQSGKLADALQTAPKTVPKDAAADPNLYTMLLAPTAVHGGRRLDCRLSVKAAIGLARIREGLVGTRQKLADGRQPNPNSSADYVRLLLERAGDPDVKEIVFVTSTP